MKTVTFEQIVAWKPCGLHDDEDGENYTPERIRRLMGDRETLTANDIAALDIPADDRVWALLHNEFLTDKQMHILAYDFAETVVHLCNDPRAQAAIDAKRAWVRGEITDSELFAASDAACAASAAAWDAARAAAWDAAWGAASTAAWYAARAAAREKQIAMILAEAQK